MMKKLAACLAGLLILTLCLAGCDNAAVKPDPSGSAQSDATASVSKKGGKTTTAGEASASKTGPGTRPSTTVDAQYSNNPMGSVTTVKVKHKAYTETATGSKYATGIKLPKLSKSQAKVSYMTNTSWDFIKTESSEMAPTAIYHAMCIWKSVYGVDVEIELVDWDNFTSYLITSVVAGEGPDVMRWVNGRPKWINNGLVTTLEDKLDLTDKDYDFEAMQKYSALYGHLYAAYSQGLQMPSSVMIYNKTKFEKAGEPDPMTLYKQGKWTFSQFIKTAKAMTNAAADEYGLSGTGAFYPPAFGLMSLNKDMTVTLHIKDSKFVKCMQAVWKLYREENAARRTDDSRDIMPRGKDAMTLTSLKEACRMLDTAKRLGTTDKFGFAPAPSYDMVGEKNPRGNSTMTMDAFSISSCPKNLEGAVEFVRLVTKVGTNISKQMGQWGWAKSYMSADEKAVFSKVKYVEGGVTDCTDAIDGTNTPMNEQFTYPIYLNSNKTKELSSILASAQSVFSGVIKEYEINAGLRK